jgi:hypothetical protein
MPVDRGRHMGDRIVRVEALVEQLVRQVGPGAGGLAGQVQDPATSSSRDPNPSPTVPAPKSISSELGRCLGKIKPCSVCTSACIIHEYSERLLTKTRT